jgi:hypothetical protein
MSHSEIKQMIVDVLGLIGLFVVCYLVLTL